MKEYERNHRAHRETNISVLSREHKKQKIKTMKAQKNLISSYRAGTWKKHFRRYFAQQHNYLSFQHREVRRSD